MCSSKPAPSLTSRSSLLFHFEPNRFCSRLFQRGAAEPLIAGPSHSVDTRDMIPATVCDSTERSHGLYGTSRCNGFQLEHATVLLKRTSDGVVVQRKSSDPIVLWIPRGVVVYSTSLTGLIYVHAVDSRIEGPVVVYEPCVCFLGGIRSATTDSPESRSSPSQPLHHHHYHTCT